MFLINDAVDVLITEKALGMLLNKDAVVVDTTVNFAVIERIMDAVDDKMTDMVLDIVLTNDAVVVDVAVRYLLADLIKVAVVELITLLIKLTVLTNDAVVVEVAVLVSEMARLNVDTEAWVTDNKIKWKALSVNITTVISLTRVKDFLIALIKLEVVVEVTNSSLLGNLIIVDVDAAIVAVIVLSIDLTNDAVDVANADNVLNILAILKIVLVLVDT